MQVTLLRGGGQSRFSEFQLDSSAPRHPIPKATVALREGLLACLPFVPTQPERERELSHH